MGTNNNNNSNNSNNMNDNTNSDRDRDRHNYTSLEQELDELEIGQEPTPHSTVTTTTTTFAENTQPNNTTTNNNTTNNKPTVLELYAAQKKKKTSKSQKDRKEAMVQALLYIFVFLVSYIFSAVYNSMDQSGKTPSYYLLLTSQIFYPLQGFLIFFIYLRPNVVSIKRRNPTHSFFQILKAAITSRGEDPRKMKRRRTFKKLSRRASMNNAATSASIAGGLGESAGNRNSSSTGNGERRRYSLNVCTRDEEEEERTVVQFRKRTSETDLDQSNESERSSQKRVRLAPHVMEELNHLYQEGEKRDMEKGQQQEQQQQQQLEQLEQKEEEEEKKQEGIEDGMDLEDEEERNLKNGLLKLSSELEE